MRRYFRRAEQAKAIQQVTIGRPPKATVPLDRPVVITKTAKGDTRTMAAGEAQDQLWRSKGGQTAHARGTGHRWTTETARKAAQRRWKRFPIHARTGTRTFQDRRPRQSRAVLRRRHRIAHATRPFYQDGAWAQYRKGLGLVQLSERTALTILGYLKPPNRGYVPSEVLARPLQQKRTP